VVSCPAAKNVGTSVGERPTQSGNAGKMRDTYEPTRRHPSTFDCLGDRSPCSLGPITREGRVLANCSSRRNLPSQCLLRWTPYYHGEVGSRSEPSYVVLVGLVCHARLAGVRELLSRQCASRVRYVRSIAKRGTGLEA